MVDLTEAHMEVPEAEKEVPSAEKEQPEQGLTRKRRHSTLGSTSTSALDRLIHADPCSDVPLKRIPEEVREAMARYARAPVLGENPMAHVGSLVGPEAARENLLRANPQWRVPGAEERNPAMMAQYYLNEAVFWSSFASECSSVEERQLRRYQEAYARDIPVLDQKAGQLMAEMKLKMKLPVSSILVRALALMLILALSHLSQCHASGWKQARSRSGRGHGHGHGHKSYGSGHGYKGRHVGRGGSNKLKPPRYSPPNHPPTPSTPTRPSGRFL
ncbi:uncharacterized protein [Spinacia oleracea]|uniref:Uncharacterized protein n=1 Tax=Spinacia oleracea TaxID=3562 RepID=A0ABM3RPX9_SPIOL|nr:uncharacterized protein LOC130471520 [Spinacia oleracea]